MSFCTEQYFRECELQERQWRAKVNINRKTELVNIKLAKWHQENPDRAVVNLAAMRIAYARRRQAPRRVVRTA